LIDKVVKFVVKGIVKIFNKICIPFAILNLRWVQYRYKRITTHNYYNRRTSYIAHLLLYKSKERYYKSQFDSWGKYCYKFGWSEDELSRHNKFMNWLFPKKDFEEWDIIEEWGMK